MPERVARSVLLVNSGGEGPIADWLDAFAAEAPWLDARDWDDASVPAADVRYAMVWEPEPGRLAGYPGLALILSSGAGVDHLLADPALPPHVPIVRMGGAEPAQRVGEYVALAALGLLRDLPRLIAARAARQWDWFAVPRAATDTRAGVLGLGNIGTRAAIMLRDLGFRTEGWSRGPKHIPGVASHVGADGLAALLARSDILVCLLPGTPETQGILGAANLAKLPRGAGVVNAGRGGHVVLPDLIAALDAGHLSGAVLDVFETEPLAPDHPAWVHPRIIVTSHVGGLATQRQRARFAADAIAALERGERPEGWFDRARGY